MYGLVYEINPNDEASLESLTDRKASRGITPETMEIELQLVGDGGKSVVQGLAYIDERRVEEGEPWEEYIYRMNMGIDDATARGLPRWYINKYMRRFILASFRSCV